ncbi:RING finger protein 112 [Paroedura picta]|uniref:RING finger protein 112 n=1 Tax=Paroedura picta TaxID=143630 RepID=UPI004056AE6E
MGNTNTKPLTPPPLPAKKPPGGMIHELQQDIVCSICLDTLKDPVSIDCGHNFCSACISTHWKGLSLRGHHCPECRFPCSPERMKVDTRLRNLVEKIKEIPLLEMEREPATPAATSQAARQAVQLVGLDEEENLCLDEQALRSCLEQGEVKGNPICLVSIFGKQRHGKSFLQNFLLRRLRNMGAEEASWMGQEDEPLTGFEWRPGFNSATKGVWLWSQPFWITSEQEKVATFVIDTEGSQDLERSKETSTKLSAFSMLLSSYQIFNVSSQINDSDLEYLEMFAYAAEMVGKACGLKPFQQLDILVRDYVFSPVYGLQEGQKYLCKVIQKLESNNCRHQRALEILKSSSTRCYLMPFPGKKLVMGTKGSPAEMDADFRECLKDYVSGLARSSGTYLKRDQNGKALTGAQLAAKIKHLSLLMKEHRVPFDSVVQMAIRLTNQETQNTLKGEFAEFIKEQDQLSRPRFASLKVRPSTMAVRLKEKQQELLKKCEEAVRGNEQERLDTKLVLECHLQKEANDFLECYGRRHKKHAIAVGFAVGMGSLGLAGGVTGAGVVGAILATEAIVLSTEMAATVAIGAVAGTGTLALVGGGVGAGIGQRIGQRRAQEVHRLAESDVEVEEGEEDVSDQRFLINQ